MADSHHHQGQVTLSGGPRYVGGSKMVVCATLAGVAVGGPLLGMMGFSFLATVTLLLISSPLLLIFSPLLLGAAFVFAGALVGFTVAALMAVSGVYMLAWSLRQVGDFVGFGGEGVKQQKKYLGGYLQQKTQDYPPEKY